MKKLISIFGLIFVLLLMTSVVIADNGFTCCTWYNEAGCMGSCGEGLVCIKTGSDSCTCSEAPVPEFVTPAIAMAILLSSPAFAYLIIRRRH
ncbi:MAG: hypothetical protein DRG35_04695 [Deltaproteobacteria bacterium]|nr:MAG: hypothetical protein DRG35_04695 [Deltaproteobacteria bacterium]